MFILFIIHLVLSNPQTQYLSNSIAQTVPKFSVYKPFPRFNRNFIKCWENLLKKVIPHKNYNLEARKKPNVWVAKAYDTFLNPFREQLEYAISIPLQR